MGSNSGHRGCGRHRHGRCWSQSPSTVTVRCRWLSTAGTASIFTSTPSGNLIPPLLAMTILIGQHRHRAFTADQSCEPFLAESDETSWIRSCFQRGSRWLNWKNCRLRNLAIERQSRPTRVLRRSGGSIFDVANGVSACASSAALLWRCSGRFDIKRAGYTGIDAIRKIRAQTLSRSGIGPFTCGRHLLRGRPVFVGRQTGLDQPAGRTTCSPAAYRSARKSAK